MHSKSLECYSPCDDRASKEFPRSLFSEVFFQMVGKESFFSLLTEPSTWIDLSKESGEKWSEQTAKRPSGLKCARCVPTKAFQTASLLNTTSRRHAFTIKTQKKAGEQLFRILFLLCCGTRTKTPSLHIN